jgi:hypothetical protein
MSFWMVQIISVVGVAGVIALTWAVGWGKRARIVNLEAASARFHADFPAAEIKGGALGRDGRAALLELGEGFGLVTVLGDELVTRKLRARDIASATAGGQDLLLTLADPTLPPGRLSLGTKEAATWAEKLSDRNFLTRLRGRADEAGEGEGTSAPSASPGSGPGGTSSARPPH